MEVRRLLTVWMGDQLSVWWGRVGGRWVGEWLREGVVDVSALIREREGESGCKEVLVPTRERLHASSAAHTRPLPRLLATTPLVADTHAPCSRSRQRFPS